MVVCSDCDKEGSKGAGGVTFEETNMVSDSGAVDAVNAPRMPRRLASMIDLQNVDEDKSWRDYDVKHALDTLDRLTVEDVETVNNVPSTLFDLRCAPEETVTLEAYVRRAEKYIKPPLATYRLMVFLLERIGQEKIDNIVLTLMNRHKLTFAALVVADKFTEDVPYHNDYLAKVAGMPLSELNELENIFLSLIEWRIYISTDEYRRIDRACFSNDDELVSVSEDLRLPILCARPSLVPEAAPTYACDDHKHLTPEMAGPAAMADAAAAEESCTMNIEEAAIILADTMKPKRPRALSGDVIRVSKVTGTFSRTRSADSPDNSCMDNMEEDGKELKPHASTSLARTVARALATRVSGLGLRLTGGPADRWGPAA